MYRLTLTLFLSLFLSLPAWAQPSVAVPNLVDVQGFLRTQSGQPVNKTVSLKVTLYDMAAGGNQLHTETIPLVPVTGGRFSVQLGTVKAIPQDLFSNNTKVFVAISVDGSPELPRQQFATVAYAYKAQVAVSAVAADTASGLDCTGCVVEANIGDGAVTSAKIGVPCDNGQVLKKIGAGWGCGKDDDTKYSGADFAKSNQACAPGLAVSGVGVDGMLSCIKVETASYSAGAGLALDQNKFVLDLGFTDARYVNAGEPNSVTKDMIADGAVTGLKLGFACTKDQILKVGDNGWACTKDEGLVYTGKDFVPSNQVCPAGNVVQGAKADGTIVCVKDDSKVYTGADFALSDQTCPAGFVMAGVGADGKPACQLDDKGTDYTAGPGIAIAGGKISLVQTCAAGNVLKWNDMAKTWECQQDSDTKYTAGTGLKLDLSQFSVDQTQIATWAKAACFDTDAEVLAVVAAAGYMKKTDKLDQTAMPGNGLNEVSNGLIWDQFVDETKSPNTPVKIPDQNPIGIADELTFPDIGLAEKLTVSVDISTSNTNQIIVYLYDPQNVEYILHNKGGSAQSLKTSYPDPTAAVSGDLTTWVGKNPQGKWRLKVIDTAWLNNQTDGQINSWSVAIQTLSTKKIRVAGDQFIDGNLTVNGATTLNTLAASGAATLNSLTVNGASNLKGDVTFGGKITGATGLQINGDMSISGTAAFNKTGAAPFTVASETRVDKLNTDRIDGFDSTNLMGGVTYIHWGGTTCGTGWSAVSTGSAVMIVERQNWGRAGDVICYEGALSQNEVAGLAWSYQGNCSYIGGARPCAVCAPDTGAGRPMGQCFNKWGSSTCPTGWTAMFDGWIATAMEGNNWGDQGGTVCMDKGALSCNWGAGGSGISYSWAASMNMGSGKPCTVCCR